MNMKALCRLSEHTGRGPLLWPKTDLGQHLIVAPRELTKQSALSLWINRPWKNLDTRNPQVLKSISAGLNQFASFNPISGHPLGESFLLIVAGPEGCPRFLRNSPPKIIFCIAHY